ncbi:hypothetical protein TNCV_4656021 [Trichonephila clavipes]|nr:hypothetical protein TNCV_4656021 [Trichonephila clavipes]
MNSIPYSGSIRICTAAIPSPYPTKLLFRSTRLPLMGLPKRLALDLNCSVDFWPPLIGPGSFVFLELFSCWSDGPTERRTKRSRESGNVIESHSDLGPFMMMMMDQDFSYRKCQVGFEPTSFGFEVHCAIPHAYPMVVKYMTRWVSTSGTVDSNLKSETQTGAKILWI